MRGVLVVAGIASALLLGCSSAGRRGPEGPRYGGSCRAGLQPRRSATLQGRDHDDTAQQTLDLMPAPPARDSAGRRDDADTVEASGPLRTSPDGRWIAFESDRGGVHGVWVARRDGRQGRRVSGVRTALSPSWSPDGTALIFLARDAKRPDTWNIWVAHPAEGDARKVATAGTAAPAGTSWFPDSRHVCYGSGNWLIVADTQTGAMRAFRLPNETSRIAGVPAVSPDGRRVVFAVAGEGAWVAALPDGAMKQVVSEAEVDGFAWAPGGRQIAFRSARDGRWKVQTVK